MQGIGKIPMTIPENANCHNRNLTYIPMYPLHYKHISWVIFSMASSDTSRIRLIFSVTITIFVQA